MENLTWAELLERNNPNYVYTITQERLDAEKPEDHSWLFPGVTGPGRYTWNEREHTYVPEGKTAPVAQPQPTPAPSKPQERRNVRTNRRGQHCYICGGWVEPGQGELEYVDPDNEGSYGFQSGWLVSHLDTSICKAQKIADEAAEQASRQRQAEREAEQQALVQRVASETGLQEKMDWSWDDFRFGFGNRLAETEHFTAHEYTMDGNVIGFTVKKKGVSL